MPTYRIDKDGMHYQFMVSRKPVQMIGGGYGNGKTAALCVKAIRLAIDYPGSNGLVGRASYAKLNDTVRKEFYKWMPAKAVARWPTANDNTMVLTNGSVINFRYIAQRGKSTNEGQTTSNLLSATYDWILIDQLEDPEIQYKDFLDLQGRLRGSTPYKGDDPTMPMTGPRWFMCNCNPTSNWVYGKLVRPLHQFKATGKITDGLLCDPLTNEPIIDLFEGSTYENKKNLPEDFLTRLEATYKGQMKDRFLLGKWAAYEGLVYPEFSLDMHMVPHEILVERLHPRHLDKNRYDPIQGLDVGIVVPSCYLFGYTDEVGRVCIIDGFYEPGLTVDKMYDKMFEIQDMYRYGIDIGREPLYADPAIFKQTQVNGKTTTTVAKLLQDRGLYVKAAQNAITSGIMKVSTYLAPVEGMSLVGKKEGPMIVFSDHLDFVADEFLSYFWKADETGNRKDEPIGRNDHAMDTVKYLLTRSPEATELVYRQPVLTPEMFKWHEAM